MTEDVVAAAIKAYGADRTSLLPILQQVAAKKKYLSEEDFVRIGRAFGITAAEAYSVASYYSLLETQPCGKYVIRVCRTISCSLSSKESILDKLKEILGIEVGETTKDRLFSLVETNCMGWCSDGPAMLINDTVHTHLTPEKIADIIKKYRSR
jgi:NADH:ubiquinone oxidoreductase subunit E